MSGAMNRRDILLGGLAAGAAMAVPTTAHARNLARAFEEAFNVAVGDAPRDGDDDVGARLLQLPKAAQLSPQAVFGTLPHGATGE